MKQPFIILAAILITTAGWSQTPGLKAVRSEIIAGRFLNNNSPIKGVEYLFDARVNSFGFDSTASNCLVQFRELRRNGKSLKNKGYFGVFNFESDSLYWLQKINYITRKPFVVSGILLSHRDDYTVERLDFNTGEKIWKVKGGFWHIHDNPPVAFFYDVGYPSEVMEPMTAFNLRTGKLLWRRDMPREGGWQSVLYPADSTLLISSNGLHQFNAYTGKGWDYNALTVKKDYAGVVVGVSFGIAFGALGGAFVIPLGGSYGPGVATYGSNILADSSHLWYASRKRLSCLSHEGDSLWSVPIESDNEGQSYLWTRDSLLYRLNLGFAYHGRAKVSDDKPSIESFDRETGTKKSFRALGKKRDFIRQFDISTDTMVLLFDKKLVSYDYSRDQALDTAFFDDSELGKPYSLLADRVYYRVSDSLYKHANSLFHNRYPIIFTEGKIALINSELHVTDTIERSRLFLAQLGFGTGSVLLRDKKKLIAIDNEGKPFATIDIGEDDFQIFGDWLYYVDNKRLVAVYMSTFM
ncbi:MAG TPA: hypothetical protein DCR43_03630 [Bacteroidales bacterium]|nr:MAG: hypothetical protein A2X11_12725 [Bacteroidetes bacterium GWE2_42_24]OFY28221.1 MAG: hypothetical protein A2X09_13510 [Bacteroidetes bacterium GWF2_43_11]HAQ64934.1 hypothetical protein [Bacteroidales bacterium]HBZ65669.1 hypothetical protein [Bacteroidales bacterium]